MKAWTGQKGLVRMGINDDRLDDLLTLSCFLEEENHQLEISLDNARGSCISVQRSDRTRKGVYAFGMVLLEMKSCERRNRQRKECAGDRGSRRQKGRGWNVIADWGTRQGG